MPPRLPTPSKRLIPHPTRSSTPFICHQCRATYASLATTPAPPISPSLSQPPPIARHPPTKPPSHKPPEFRKSQLHRQYQSLLRSCPLTVIFQHNNLKSTEWMGVRRELDKALRKVDEELASKEGEGVMGGMEGMGGVMEGMGGVRVGEGTKMVVVQTGIFASALRVVEFWDPKFDNTSSSSPSASSSPTVYDQTGALQPSPSPEDLLTHGLSTKAWMTSKSQHKKTKHGLEPLLSGPLALLTFPSVSPQHLAAALSILAPSPAFPAPKRRENPAYHEPAVQNGLSKLLLLGARIEGRVFDLEGTRWVGGIEGGLEGLRGQLVAMLQSLGGALTSTLEGAGRSLWVAVEGRRGMLEEEEKGKGKVETGS